MTTLVQSSLSKNPTNLCSFPFHSPFTKCLPMHSAYSVSNKTQPNKDEYLQFYCLH